MKKKVIHGILVGAKPPLTPLAPPSFGREPSRGCSRSPCLALRRRALAPLVLLRSRKLAGLQSQPFLALRRRALAPLVLLRSRKLAGPRSRPLFGAQALQ